jgi:hypothetical protein
LMLDVRVHAATARNATRHARALASTVV